MARLKNIAAKVAPIFLTRVCFHPKTACALPSRRAGVEGAILSADQKRQSNDLGANNQIMIDWSSCPDVERDAERVSGAWLFHGSRVPVAALFENLEDGVPVGEFVELFPGVSLAQARSVLEHVARSSLASA